MVTYTPSRTPTTTPTSTPTWLPLDLQCRATLAEICQDVEKLCVPAYYDIKARIDLSDSQLTISGQEQVLFENTEGEILREIYFRLYPNAPAYNGTLVVRQVSLANQPVKPALSVQDTVLRLDLPIPLLPGQSVQVAMSFHTAVPTDSQTHYQIFNYASGMAVLSNFYPQLAVYDERGWNIEPISMQGDAVYSDIAFYRVQLTAPKEMVLVTSGSLVAQTPDLADTVTRTFVSGPARDFGLLASSRYQMSKAMVGETEVRSFYLPEDAEGGEAILDYACHALRIYQARFGPYPYIEFDVVEAPIAAGGMEMPGLIMIQSNHYTHTDGYDEFVVAHEVAHQWWYNLVGNDQPNEPWVDEALTNYTAILYYEDRYGPSKAAQALQWYLRDPYQRVVDATADMPANLPADAYEDPLYYRIVYAKAGLFYHALRQRLGDAEFFSLLRDYLATYRYRNVSSSEVLAFWSERASKDIHDLIVRWIVAD